MPKNTAAYTIEQMQAALEANEGFFYLAAQALGCSAKTVERYVQKHERLRDIVKQYRGQRVDVVEGVLWKKAEAGEPWAVCFFLKTQAKDRGYTERQEVTGSEGKALPPLQIVLKKDAGE